MATQVIFEKLVAEELSIEFDMLSRMKVGETVSTTIVTVTVFSGVDSNPALMISGSATISGSIVTQKVIGGLPGVIYLLSCSIRTSSNNILVNEAKLVVRSSSAATPA